MPRWKVTRTWYVEAEGAVAAIEESAGTEHSEVRATRDAGATVGSFTGSTNCEEVDGDLPAVQ